MTKKAIEIFAGIGVLTVAVIIALGLTYGNEKYQEYKAEQERIELRQERIEKIKDVVCFWEKD